MNTTKQSFPELEDLKRRLEHQLEIVRFKAEELQKQLDSVTTTLTLLKQQGLGSDFLHQMNAVSPNDLRGFTQLEALIKIARANNNRFKLSTAKSLLLRAGVTKSPKNANNIIFNVIARSGRFKRVSPGEYELIGEPTHTVKSSASIPFEALSEVRRET